MILMKSLLLLLLMMVLIKRWRWQMRCGNGCRDLHARGGGGGIGGMVEWASEDETMLCPRLHTTQGGEMVERRGRGYSAQGWGHGSGFGGTGWSGAGSRRVCCAEGGVGWYLW